MITHTDYGYPPGWEGIISEGVAKINEILKRDPSIPFEITDIKSKFGTLRFYFNGGNEEIEQIVDNMELLSATACEVCGREGTQYGRGWIYTACPEHVEEKDRGGHT